jgi:phosphoglycerate dehydrogenase-like enzyme
MTRSPDQPILKLLIAVRHPFNLWSLPDWFVPKLHRDFPSLQVVNLDDYDAIDVEIRDADIAIGWSFRPQQIRAARKLRWIHSTAAAVHTLMFSELIDSEIILTNARDVHGPVVAEHVIALIFTLAKKIPQAVRMQQKHAWGQHNIWEDPPQTREIAGATLGLIGLGTIGREVARHANGLGMKVIAARENPQKETPEGIQQVFPSTEREKLLIQSDFVVLCAPVTSHTRNLIDAAGLAQMKPDAYLINVGRGELIDEPALIDALRNHRIGGAALDVFEKEPLPADSPFWDLDNLLITPHTAGLSHKMWERHYALFTENLRRYLSGQPLLAVVNKSAGY